MARFFLTIILILAPALAEAKEPPRADQASNGQLVGRPTVSVNCGDGMIVILSERMPAEEVRKLTTGCAGLGEISNDRALIDGVVAGETRRTIDLSSMTVEEFKSLSSEQVQGLIALNEGAKMEIAKFPEGGMVVGPGAASYGSMGMGWGGSGAFGFTRLAMAQQRAYARRGDMSAFPAAEPAVDSQAPQTSAPAAAPKQLPVSEKEAYDRRVKDLERQLEEAKRDKATAAKAAAVPTAQATK